MPAGAEPMATIPIDSGRIAYRRIGQGRPLLLFNGLAATGADWDPAFIDRLACASELVLLDNRGIGASLTTERRSTSTNLLRTSYS